MEISLLLLLFSCLEKRTTVTVADKNEGNPQPISGTQYSGVYAVRYRSVHITQTSFYIIKYNIMKLIFELFIDA